VIDLYNNGASPPPAQQTAQAPARDPVAESPEAPEVREPPAPVAPASPESRSPSAAATALAGGPTQPTEVDASGRRVTRGAGAENAVDPLSARPAEISLTIHWTEPAAAAVFRRAGYLWVVFDRPTEVDVDAMAKSAAPYITYVEQLPYRNN